MGIFDFLDYCDFLRREIFIFINSKLAHGPRLLVAKSVSQLRIDENNRSRRINSKSTKFEVRFSKILVKSAF